MASVLYHFRSDFSLYSKLTRQIMKQLASTNTCVLTNCLCFVFRPARRAFPSNCATALCVCKRTHRCFDQVHERNARHQMRAKTAPKKVKRTHTRLFASGSLPNIYCTPYELNGKLCKTQKFTHARPPTRQPSAADNEHIL